MKLLAKSLLILLISQLTILTCRSQGSQWRYQRGIVPAADLQLAMVVNTTPIAFLAARGKRNELNEIFSNANYSLFQLPTRDAYQRRSRLCVVGTIAFASAYMFTRQKDNDLALGSAVAALATSSFGLVYYIKARK